MRKMARLRIRICAFEMLIPFVEPGSSVLDVGCGKRVISGTSRGVNITSGRMWVRFVQTCHLDLTEPWPSGLFRVVSMIDVLHHVDRSQQKALFQKVAERVKPGGLFLYKDMANGPFLPAAMNRLHDLVLARQWISYVPIAEADRWAEEMGLVREHAEEISRLWYRHELRLYRKPA